MEQNPQLERVEDFFVVKNLQINVEKAVEKTIE